MCYIFEKDPQGSDRLGLVEFKKCAILSLSVVAVLHELGLVEFKKCAIFTVKSVPILAPLGLVEFKKCAIL